MKWSSSAAILSAITVLLIAYVCINWNYSRNINQVNSAYVNSQQEISKTKTKLEVTETEKAKLAEEVRLKADKIIQLEMENAELKD